MNMYLKVSFASIDSGLFGNLRASIPSVLMAIQRSAWRDTKGVEPVLQELYESGLLVSRLSVEKVSANSGVCESTVYRCIRELEAIGIIYRISAPFFGWCVGVWADRDPKTHRAKDKDPNAQPTKVREELFFSDYVAEEMYGLLSALRGQGLALVEGKEGRNALLKRRVDDTSGLMWALGGDVREWLAHYRCKRGGVMPRKLKNPVSAGDLDQRRTLVRDALALFTDHKLRRVRWESELGFAEGHAGLAAHFNQVKPPALSPHVFCAADVEKLTRFQTEFIQRAKCTASGALASPEALEMATKYIRKTGSIMKLSKPSEVLFSSRRRKPEEQKEFSTFTGFIDYCMRHVYLVYGMPCSSAAWEAMETFRRQQCLPWDDEERRAWAKSGKPKSVPSKDSVNAMILLLKEQEAADLAGKGKIAPATKAADVLDAIYKSLQGLWKVPEGWEQNSTISDASDSIHLSPMTAPLLSEVEPKGGSFLTPKANSKEQQTLSSNTSDQNPSEIAPVLAHSSKNFEQMEAALASAGAEDKEEAQSPNPHNAAAPLMELLASHVHVPVVSAEQSALDFMQGVIVDHNTPLPASAHAEGTPAMYAAFTPEKLLYMRIVGAMMYGWLDSNMREQCHMVLNRPSALKTLQSLGNKRVPNDALVITTDEALCEDSGVQYWATSMGQHMGMADEDLTNLWRTVHALHFREDVSLLQQAGMHPAEAHRQVKRVHTEAKMTVRYALARFPVDRTVKLHVVAEPLRELIETEFFGDEECYCDEDAPCTCGIGNRAFPSPTKFQDVQTTFPPKNPKIPRKPSKFRK